MLSLNKPSGMDTKRVYSTSHWVGPLSSLVSFYRRDAASITAIEGWTARVVSFTVLNGESWDRRLHSLTYSLAPGLF